MRTRHKVMPVTLVATLVGTVGCEPDPRPACGEWTLETIREDSNPGPVWLTVAGDGATSAFYLDDYPHRHTTLAVRSSDGSWELSEIDEARGWIVATASFEQRVYLLEDIGDETLLLTRNGDLPWQSETALEGDGIDEQADIQDRTLSVDADGLPNFAYLVERGSQPGIRHARRRANGKWQVAQVAAAQDAEGYYAVVNSLVRGPGGNHLLYWLRSSMHYAREREPERWTVEEVPVGVATSGWARLALEPSGAPHIMLLDRDREVPIEISRSGPDEAWVSEVVRADGGVPLAFAIDSQGMLHAILKTAGDTLHARKPPGGDWTATPLSAEPLEIMGATFVVDAHDNLHLAFTTVPVINIPSFLSVLYASHPACQ